VYARWWSSRVIAARAAGSTTPCSRLTRLDEVRLATLEDQVEARLALGEHAALTVRGMYAEWEASGRPAMVACAAAATCEARPSCSAA
jgi:hypothetical protein